MADRTEKIKDLQNQIQSLQNELEGEREGCTHPSYKVGYWLWRVGSINVSRICCECLMEIQGITDEEIIEFKRLEPFNRSGK